MSISLDSAILTAKASICNSFLTDFLLIYYCPFQFILFPASGVSNEEHKLDHIPSLPKNFQWFPTAFRVKTRILTEMTDSYSSLQLSSNTTFSRKPSLSPHTQVECPVNMAEKVGSGGSSLGFVTYFCHTFLIWPWTALVLFPHLLKGDNKGTCSRGLAVRTKRRTHGKHLEEYG